MCDRRASLAAWVLLTTACSLAPSYERPAAPIPSTFNGETAASPASGEVTSAADLGWREVLVDDRLQALVELALASNRDLRVASLNVDQARARFGIERSAAFPEVDATGSFTRSRTPLDQSTIGAPYTSSMWTAGGGFSWELDFFGRVRSLKEAALQRWFATVEARRAATLSLVAAVAESDLQLRALDEEIALTVRTQALVQSTYDLTRSRFEVGQASELDLRITEGQLQEVKVNLASLGQQRDAAANALVLLVGQPLPATLPPAAPLAAGPVLTDLPAGLPSEVLARRPDVLEAEHTLQADNANIGAARAAFFPSISLTGQGGFSSNDLGRLFDGSSGFWSISPQVNVPIFNGGRNRANLEVAKTEREIAVAQYEKALQSAFREVADALSARGRIEARLDAEATREKALARRYELTDLRYRQGIDNSLSALLAQQDLFASQTRLVEARLARLQNLIELYRALGGGWSERRAQASGEPAQR